MGGIGLPRRTRRPAAGRSAPPSRRAAALLLAGAILVGCDLVELPVDGAPDPIADEVTDGPQQDPADGRPPPDTVPEDDPGTGEDPDGETDQEPDGTPESGDDPTDEATPRPEPGENEASKGGVAIALGGPRLGSPLKNPTDLFGDVPVGVPSAPAEVRFSNDLPVPQRISVSTDDFHLESDGCTGRSLAPADACAVRLVVTPGTVGPFIGALRVDSMAECDPTAEWHWCDWEPGEVTQSGEPVREEVSSDQWLLHYSDGHPLRGVGVE